MKRPPSSSKKASRAGEPRDRRAASNVLPVGYRELLDDLKARVRATQFKAALAANREPIELYWDIGRLIVERQQEQGWGTSVIDRLAADLQRAFPRLMGFSASNVSRMRSFYLAYEADEVILSQPVTELTARRSAQAVPKLASRVPPELAGLPWGHNVVLLFKLRGSSI